MLVDDEISNVILSSSRIYSIVNSFFFNKVSKLDEAPKISKLCQNELLVININIPKHVLILILSLKILVDYIKLIQKKQTINSY